MAKAKGTGEAEDPMAVVMEMLKRSEKREQTLRQEAAALREEAATREARLIAALDRLQGAPQDGGGGGGGQNQNQQRQRRVLESRDPMKLSGDPTSREMHTWEADFKNHEITARAGEFTQAERIADLQKHFSPEFLHKFLMNVLPKVVPANAATGPTVKEVLDSVKAYVKEHKIIAPCWIVVTSQEKLDEVVAAIDSKRVELAKLQDRFGKHKVLQERVNRVPVSVERHATNG